MILDAHCHAWARWPYHPPVPDPSRGNIGNLLWEMEHAGVARAIVICAAIGGNPENFRDVVAATEGAAGRLMPFADFDCRWHPTHHAPGAAVRLRALLDGARSLKGVTHYMVEDSDASWLLSEDGQACLALLEERGIVLSLAAGPRQAATVAAAASRVPRLPVLVHHLFRVRANDEEALAAVVEAARAAPNLVLKLSGHGYAAEDGWDFPLWRVQALVRDLAAAFGPHRLVWGSDWPVSTRYMTYRQALEIVRRHAPGFTPDERDAVLGGTLQRLLDGARA
jgi:L-fuconolactonase